MGEGVSGKAEDSSATVYGILRWGCGEGSIDSIGIYSMQWRFAPIVIGDTPQCPDSRLLAQESDSLWTCFNVSGIGIAARMGNVDDNERDVVLLSRGSRFSDRIFVALPHSILDSLPRHLLGWNPHFLDRGRVPANWSGPSFGHLGPSCGRIAN
jgi:hypothetical protein